MRQYEMESSEENMTLILLGKSELFEGDDFVDVNRFLTAVAFEKKQLEARFPGLTTIDGDWEGSGLARKYVLYAMKELRKEGGPEDET